MSSEIVDRQDNGMARPRTETSSTATLSAQLSFPEKLMEILEKDMAPEAVWWMPGNKTFAVHPNNFSSQVLDKFFQRTKFMSFVRKLNQWGFRRIPGQSVPHGVVVYVHAQFKKGAPELLKDISDRKKARGKKAQKKAALAAVASTQTSPPASPVLPVKPVQAAVQGDVATHERHTVEVADAATSASMAPSSILQEVLSAPSIPLSTLHSLQAALNNSSAGSVERKAPSPAPASLDLSSELGLRLAQQVLARATMPTATNAQEPLLLSSLLSVSASSSSSSLGGLQLPSLAGAMNEARSNYDLDTLRLIMRLNAQQQNMYLSHL